LFEGLGGAIAGFVGEVADFGVGPEPALVGLKAGLDPVSFLAPPFVAESPVAGFGAAFFTTSTVVPVPVKGGTASCACGFSPAPVAASPGASLAAVPAGFVPATSGSLSGTEGSRWARISAARTLPPLSAATGARSCFSVTTSTSSSRLKSAVGFTLMLRNISLPGPTWLTVPTGSPFGKIWSPQLLSTFSPGMTFSSLMTRSRINSPFGVPRATPCNRDFSSIAPTPLL
jgi:hypothetical protein